MKRLLQTLLLSLLLALPTMAADFRAFGASSLARIEQAHQGQAFMLVFWSVDCAYCMEEIQQLAGVVRQYPAMRLVLVNTDRPEIAPQASALLDRYFAEKAVERWMFASDDTERLYFAVDKQWRGELPRTYIYAKNSKPHVIAGRLDEKWLQTWLKTQFD